MPKDKTSIKSKLNIIVRKYPKELEIVGIKLMCKLCVNEISFTHKHGNYNVDHHFKTKKHQEKKDKMDGTAQEFIEKSFQKSELNNFKNEYFADMTKAFIEANIPLEKLNHPSLGQFLQKYTNRDNPKPSTLRNNYVSKIYENVIIKIRLVLGDSAIYLMVDETTDKKNRYVVNV